LTIANKIKINVAELVVKKAPELRIGKISVIKIIKETNKINFLWYSFSLI
tara:strand:+ start:404 stop:553 length:150 start_codon:yes stop_codon:yes gene_type:complete